MQVAALPLPLELLGTLIHDIFSNLQPPPWVLLFLSGILDFAAALLSPGSDGLSLGLAGQATILLNVRQVSLGKEAARRMSLMLSHWEQKNFTMKLVG